MPDKPGTGAPGVFQKPGTRSEEDSAGFPQPVTQEARTVTLLGLITRLQSIEGVLSGERLARAGSEAQFGTDVAELQIELEATRVELFGQNAEIDRIKILATAALVTLGEPVGAQTLEENALSQVSSGIPRQKLLQVFNAFRQITDLVPGVSPTGTPGGDI